LSTNNVLAEPWLSAKTLLAKALSVLAETWLSTKNLLAETNTLFTLVVDVFAVFVVNMFTVLMMKMFTLRESLTAKTLSKTLLTNALVEDCLSLPRLNRLMNDVSNDRLFGNDTSNGLPHLVNYVLVMDLRDDGLNDLLNELLLRNIL